MKTLYFDCFCGAAGDMIVGALIDVGADFETLRDALDTLGVEGYRVRAEKIKKHGTMATKFDVEIDAEHGQPHRHLHHIVEIIESGDLPAEVKEASLETFRRLAEAEAEVHGTTPEKIHFHEVGAVDSIVDIVATHLALHQLKPKRILSSALHVGSGTVKCAHGIMPVPAPATALLLRGIPSYGSDVDGELLTPTGAALIAQLAESFGPMPEMRVETIGSGSGTKDLPDRPNVLRVLLGETAEAASGTETIVVVEANIDDMNPELLPPLISDLLEAGARDAFLTPILGKKGRPAHLITILVDEVELNSVTGVLFRGSTTLGLRMRREQRICLEREWKTAKTPWGAVRVKIGRFEGDTTSTSPEYEDCVRVASESGVSAREVYDAAHAAAVKGDLSDA
ncbi:MAG: nickel pincer cofactor biosynthesis protein LarC [Candidatus Hydrogenedentes bacterium]|nr:nickel pincer cofactor biosynthesis protein LarC [Candidatus Hydrogenedentota bacterium]